MDLDHTDDNLAGISAKGEVNGMRRIALRRPWERAAGKTSDSSDREGVIA